MTKHNSILKISDLLNEYSKDIQEAITEKAAEIAKKGQSELKIASPKNEKNSSHKGKYAKGWRIQTTKGRGFVNCVIHNATDYQLTHLLENGHLTRSGGKTTPIKHIEPIHNECCDSFEKAVEEIIKNGG